MRSCVLPGVVVLLLSVVLLSPSHARGAFLDTTLDGGGFTSQRITDPAGANTFVGDRVIGRAAGNGLPVPIGQGVTIDVAMPAGTALRVEPDVGYTVDLILGAQDLAGASFAIISSFTGSVTADVNGGDATRTLPFFNEAIVGSQTIAFRMTSQVFPAAPAGAASLIEGFSFTFDIGPLGLLNDPPLLADELQLVLRGSTFVPNDQVATLAPLVTVVPEPAAALPLAIACAAAGLRRRRGRRTGAGGTARGREKRVAEI